jgi:hypothetical protein
VVKSLLEITEGPRLLTPRAPNEAEQAKLKRRLARLERMKDSVHTATANMVQLADRTPKATELRIRNSFVRRGLPAPGNFSDRSLPPRPLRPPSTRLISANGAALRILLTALFEAQTSKARAGTHPTNTRPLRGTRDETGWIDLIASPAQHSRRGSAGSVTVNDKKLRQLDDTLVRLGAAELVMLPNADAGANKRDGFELLDEGGQRPQGPNDRYLLPKSVEKGIFSIPLTLFTQGWIHCLEDTELAMLLLLAEAGAQKTPVKIEGDDRLRYCGLGRDAYEAHIMLNRLGLITVLPDPKRYPDGKVEDYAEEGAYLHAFSQLPENFATPAYAAVTSAINEALKQVENA